MSEATFDGKGIEAGDATDEKRNIMLAKEGHGLSQGMHRGIIKNKNMVWSPRGSSGTFPMEMILMTEHVVEDANGDVEELSHIVQRQAILVREEHNKAISQEPSFDSAFGTEIFVGKQKFLRVWKGYSEVNIGGKLTKLV